jgi:hypothetical protein
VYALFLQTLRLLLGEPGDWFCVGAMAPTEFSKSRFPATPDTNSEMHER